MDGLLVISVVSTVLVLAAVFYALKLARFAGAKSTWFVIASVLALMVFHRTSDLLSFFFPEAEMLSSGLIAESIVLVTWFLMLVGTLFIANVFRSKVKTEQELLHRNRELGALNAIAETVSRSLDLDLTLNDALDKELEVMDVEAGLIHLLDEETDELIVGVHRGLSERYVEGVNRLKVGEGLAGKVAQSGEPVVVADISSDPRLTRMVVKEGCKVAEALRPLVFVSAHT